MSEIPILNDALTSSSKIMSLDELENMPVETSNTLFNTCTRSKTERRKRPQVRHGDNERRKGRDRRLLSYM